MKIKNITWKSEPAFADLPKRHEGFVQGIHILKIHLFTYFEQENMWFLSSLLPGTTFAPIRCEDEKDCQEKAKDLLMQFALEVTEA